MKEPSIGEKAKHYDEALERAKGAHNSAKSDKENGVTDKITEYTIQLTETIFPELKESEDERIKKRILLSLQKDIMATKNSGCNTKDLEECIVWLKKQGEQKPAVVIPKFRVGDVIRPKGSMAEYTIESISGECYHGKGWGLHISCDDDYELVGHKPADKVETKFKVKYAGHDYNVLEIIDIAGITFYGIEDEPNHIDYVKAENCDIISGYGIKESGCPYPTKSVTFSEQKPAWSEEDDEKCDAIYSCIDSHYNGLAKDSLLVWLKSLRPLNNNYFKGYNDGISAAKFNQWKPSEEQTKAIKEAIDFLGCTKKVREDLKSLYEQLKKLREE